MRTLEDVKERLAASKARMSSYLERTEEGVLCSKCCERRAYIEAHSGYTAAEVNRRDRDIEFLLGLLNA